MPKTYYVRCEDDCLYEGMTKEQILTSIEQAVETGAVSDPDSAVISKIKEIRADATAQFWIGTEAQFNALSPVPSVGTTLVRIGSDGVMYICTDDQQVDTLINHVGNKNNPHEVTLSQVIGGATIPIANGGTGANTAEGARNNLGAASASHTHSLSSLGAASENHTHNLPDLSGVLPISKGGTGATDGAGAQTNIIGAMRLLEETDDILALAPGFYSGPNNAKPSAGYPKEIWAPLVMVWGDQRAGTAADDGYKLGGWAVIVVEYDGTVWIARRNWSQWSGWKTLYDDKAFDIQVGTAAVGTSGTTITFPHAFAGVPVVTANSSNQTSVKVESVTASSVKLTAGTSSSTVQWQAIYIPS